MKQCKNGCEAPRYTIHAHCKACENERINAWRERTGMRQSKAYYRKNRKRLIAKAKAVYKKDPETGIARAQKARTANPDKYRDANYRRLYGITLVQYEKMLALQNGVCAICQQPPVKVRLAVDHEHIRKKDTVTATSGRVRGAACFRCNKFVIGRWRAEHAVLLRRAADYLESKFDGRKL